MDLKEICIGFFLVVVFGVEGVSGGSYVFMASTVLYEDIPRLV
jgi:hypothetical protein